MDVREVHEFLNGMWESIFRLNEELKAELPGLGFKVEDVEEVFGAYIYLDGEWKLMKYPHPAFEIKPQGEVGVTLQGYYFVFAIPKEKVGRELVERFVESFDEAFIYGGTNFLDDIYGPTKRTSVDEIIERIAQSDEEVFQFEADFKSVDELKKGLMEFIAFAKSLGALEV